MMYHVPYMNLCTSYVCSYRYIGACVCDCFRSDGLGMVNAPGVAAEFESTCLRMLLKCC